MNFTNYSRDFTELTERVKKAYAEKRRDNELYAATFRGLREHGQRCYNLLLTMRKEWARELQEIKSIYSDSYLAEKQIEAENEQKELISGFKSYVTTVIELKKAAIEDLLVAPPSDSQLNLLKALQMQGSNIDENEIISMAAQMSGNYRALKALQGIAATAGYEFLIPDSLDYGSMKESMEWTEGYLKRACSAISKPLYDMPLDIVEFFGNYDATLYNGIAVSVLDENPQNMPTIPEVKPIEPPKNE